jgi:hypothetical protein
MKVLCQGVRGLGDPRPRRLPRACPRPLSPPDRQNLTMRPLIIKMLVGVGIAAIIVVFALFIVLFGSSARPV